MTRRKPRDLRPEEKELWEKVRQNTIPLHKPEKRLLEEAIKKISSPVIPTVIPAFRVGQSVAQYPSGQTQLQSASMQMDHKVFGRLKKGKISPESRIDLHGMTLAQAHPALIGFILNASANQNRLVLVITGKGKVTQDSGQFPERKGVLKRQVPEWLRQPPLNSLVQQVTDSHQNHGGAGALYVYLRRRR
ncbi:MAG: Smr/MutS family protein [Paracoccaceae bacterium]